MQRFWEIKTKACKTYPQAEMFGRTMMFNSKSEENLTQRQAQLLEYLRNHHRDNGLMPSTREIQRHFNFASQTAAMSHLRALERKGVIQRLPNKARAVVFPADLDRAEILDIPVYGAIPAGFATDVEPQAEGCISVDINTLGIPRGTKAFALKVRGDSMIGAHIVSGDTVILEFREPRKGDVVAALIDGETTLKRYLVRDGQPYLKAENDDYPDLIPAHELVIQGVLIGLLRHARREF
jgi:repressor LexA